MNNVSNHDQRTTSSGIYFCADDSNIPVVDYKSINEDKRDVLRSFQKLEPWHNMMISFYYGVWIVAGWVILHVPNIAVQLVASYFIGCCISGLPILMHEASHQLLSKNKSINRFLGFISGLPGLLSVSSYTSMHLAHHSDTHTKDDPDNIENSAGGVLPLSLIYYAVLLVGVPVYVFTVAHVGYTRAKLARRRRILMEYVLIVAVVASTFYFVPFVIVTKLWLIPLVFTIAITNIRGLAEHGLTNGETIFTQTRTVISNRFVRFMMCNLNYHIEHHLFPGVPWYNLPKVHELMKDEYRQAGSSVFPSYTRFLLDFFKASRHGIKPNVRLISKEFIDLVCG